MATSSEDQRLWLQQISSQDLARTLVREYLYQHNMFKTLSCFEAQDKENSKKIIKSTLIKMLCINNLVVNNKKLQKEKQSKSFLLLLVQYLRGKFQDRIKRQDFSENNAPSQKNQKQFSMNGDKLLTKEIIQGNKIKQKNLVNTKRKQTQGKTITQQGFYKKKEPKQQYEDISYGKKSSNAIRQEKRPSNSRPSTANPMLQPKKQEKQKFQAIYSKLCTQNTGKQVQKKEKDNDPYSVRLNMGRQSKRDDAENLQGSREKSIHKNSAIGRNNKLQSSGNTKQLRQDTKVNLKKQKEQIQLPIQSKFNERYSQFDQKQPRQDDKKIQILSQNNFEKPQPSSRRNEVQQQYFDEFEEQKAQKIQTKTKLQSVPEQEFYLKVVKNTIASDRKQQLPKQKINSIVQKKKQEQIFQQLPQKKINDFLHQNILPKNVQQNPQNQKTQEQPYYQPSNAMKRGGMKLVRKGKELTKQQDATEMIRKDIKLLPENIKPYEDQNKTNQLAAQNKEPIQETIEQTPHTKFIKISQKNEEQKPKQQPKKQTLITSQKSIPSTTVRQLKLKKKIKNSEQQPKISSKFKFDENFVDEPLNGKKQKYLYEKFSFLNMVIKHELKPKDSNIIVETKINYNQKPSLQSTGNPYAQGMSKKKKQKPLLTSKAQELKKIVFRQASPYLPKAWHQGFFLSPCQETFYGLKQIQGGPCGIIAAVQCYFLKHLLYLSKSANENDLKNELRKQICLVAALADILWKVKGKSDKIVLIIPSNRNFSGSKLQLSSLTEVEIDATSFENFYETFWTYKSSFIGQSNHGVTAIIYSIVMTKGIENIYNEVDMRQNPLIGNHGHCTQELVNLFISGQASSNCFDGKKQLQDNFTLHGINQKSQFGFLTVYETLGYLQVGKNLKNPLFPIWIISKQFHYHVIFGNHYLISENNDCQKFDLIYFDGLYTCDKFIRLTFDQVQKDEFGMIKDTGAIDKLPLIQQVLLKKWGKRKTDWNGSTKIL